MRPETRLKLTCAKHITAALEGGHIRHGEVQYHIQRFQNSREALLNNALGQK
jgi:hypothetical protein